MAEHKHSMKLVSRRTGLTPTSSGCGNGGTARSPRRAPARIAGMTPALDQDKAMKPFFSRNIDNKGRLVRALGALALLVGGKFGFSVSAWLGVTLLASGVFVAFEALRGWCFLRACGIKTKL